MRDINIRYYMSVKKPFISRLFFQKTAHNRENVSNYCNILDNEFNSDFCRWYQNNTLDQPLYFRGFIFL